MDGGRALFLSFLSQGQVLQFLSHHSRVSGDLRFSCSRDQERGTRLALGGGGGEGQNTTFIPGLLLPAD